MRKLFLLAASALAFIGAPAAAAIIPSVQSVTDNGDGTFTWLYQGTLASDQGLTQGDRLVIYDFAGLIPDSFINPYAGLITVSSEALTTPEGLALAGVGQSDDPTLMNLVFTYIGSPVNMSNEGGDTCCTERNFNGIGALSTLGGSILDGFSGSATNNGTGGEGLPAGSPPPNFGSVAVPAAAPAVPEPTTW